METIIVTGGAGFIGSHVCDELLSKGKAVICIDNFNDYYSPKRKEENIRPFLASKNFHLERSDITDYKAMEAIFLKYRPSKIIHLAARAGVRPSVENPFIYEDTNIKGTLNLLELSRKSGILNFVFGSSSSVYGINAKIPFSEEDKTDSPVSPYAATKKAGEVICHTYSHLYGLNISCLRFFTVYGPKGRPDMAPYLFTQAVMKGEPITMYGDGTSRRDYTYVADIVSGILSALEKNYRYEIFNLGNSRTVELKRLIEVVEEVSGRKAKIIHKEMPKGDVPVTFADISKAIKLLGYAPKTTIEQGMKEFAAWYKHHVPQD